MPGSLVSKIWHESKMRCVFTCNQANAFSLTYAI
jgi:hypothetical protein